MPYEITEICISCGVCADECPADAIEQIGITYIIDQEMCTECGICNEVCTIEAIVEN